MQKRSTAAGLIRGFLKDRRGNFTVITASIASVLMLSAGFAVDIAQLHNTKSHLGHALDAAVTSTARDLTVGKIAPKDARGMVEIFLRANGDPEFMDGDRLVLDSLVVDQSKNTVEATAHVDVDLYFPLFRSGDTQRVTNISAAVYSDKAIEVAMMLDVTGSMEGQKIKDLKTAANNAVDALLKGQDPKNPRVRVAIVPYAEAVNTGKLADTVFVEKEGGPNLPPPVDEPLSASAATGNDDCATERKTKDGAADFSDDSPYAERRNKQGKVYLAKVNRDDRIRVCPKAKLVALTADKQKLLDAIKDFRADGVTAGGIAVQWGYYMLSPKWRSAITDAGLGSGPAKHDRKKVAKVAILMTDGQFNTAFAGVRDDDTAQLKQGAKSRSHTESLCANMRGDGIEIFTIGFDLNNKDMKRDERDQAKSVLKNCSTADTSAIKHYFEVSTGAELDRAFQDIARNIERLAITK